MTYSIDVPRQLARECWQDWLYREALPLADSKMSKTAEKEHESEVQTAP